MRRELEHVVRVISPVTEIDESSGNSDATAIRASLEDPASFEVLFDRHHDAIWRYVCRRAGAGLADELASETFLRAFDGRMRYDLSQPDSRAWLYGIATNVLRKHARSEARRRQAYARAAVRQSIGDGLDGIAARADAAALGPAVQAALGHLRPADRETLLLFALTDLDYEGIATATGVPVGTVRSRLHRARRHVTAELAVEREPAPENAKPERSY
jgi:RNA polymerase sigma factor (sigma-70 family)